MIPALGTRHNRYELLTAAARAPIERLSERLGSSVMDPQGASTGSFRVIRGGGWISYAYSCRSAYRGYYYPDDRDYCYGFRVALAPVK